MLTYTAIVVITVVVSFACFMACLAIVGWWDRPDDENAA